MKNIISLLLCGICLVSASNAMEDLKLSSNYDYHPSNTYYYRNFKGNLKTISENIYGKQIDKKKKEKIKWKNIYDIKQPTKIRNDFDRVIEKINKYGINTIQEEIKDKNITKPINYNTKTLNNNSIFNNQEDPKEEYPKEENSIKLINIDKNNNINVKDINLNNQIEKLHETRLKISEDLNNAYIGLDNIINKNEKMIKYNSPISNIFNSAENEVNKCKESLKNISNIFNQPNSINNKKSIQNGINNIMNRLDDILSNNSTQLSNILNQYESDINTIQEDNKQPNIVTEEIQEENKQSSVMSKEDIKITNTNEQNKINTGNEEKDNINIINEDNKNTINISNNLDNTVNNNIINNNEASQNNKIINTEQKVSKNHNKNKRRRENKKAKKQLEDSNNALTKRINNTFMQIAPCMMNIEVQHTVNNIIRMKNDFYGIPVKKWNELLYNNNVYWHSKECNENYSIIESYIGTIKKLLESSRVLLTGNFYDANNNINNNIMPAALSNIETIVHYIVENGIDDSNCGIIKNCIPEIRQKFVSMCQIIHDKNPQEYHFLEEKQKYCCFDCQVNKNLLSNKENKVLTNDESVLYKALLYVNCCRKLLINLNRVPDCFKNNINLCNTYYKLLLKQFREDLAPVF